MLLEKCYTFAYSSERVAKETLLYIQIITPSPLNRQPYSINACYLHQIQQFCAILVFPESRIILRLM